MDNQLERNFGDYMEIVVLWMLRRLQKKLQLHDIGIPCHDQISSSLTAANSSQSFPEVAALSGYPVEPVDAACPE